MLKKIEDIIDLSIEEVIKLFNEKDEILMDNLNSLKREIYNTPNIVLESGEDYIQLWLPSYLGSKFINDPVIVIMGVWKFDSKCYDSMTFEELLNFELDPDTTDMEKLIDKSSGWGDPDDYHGFDVTDTWEFNEILQYLFDDSSFIEISTVK